MEAIFAEVVKADAPITTAALGKILRATPQEMGDAIERLKNSGKLIGYAGTWMTAEVDSRVKKLFVETLNQAHAERADRRTVAAHLVARAAGIALSGKPLDRFLASLEEAGAIRMEGEFIRSTKFKVEPKPKAQAFLERIKVALEASAVEPPSVYELTATLRVPREAVIGALELGKASGDFVELEGGVWYSMRQLETIRDRLKETFGGRWFTANEVRDQLGTTRKYVRPLLDHLDELGWTERKDNNRRVIHR